MSDAAFIRDCIRVLLGLRPPTFHWEEAIRLHQLQNWVYRSYDPAFTTSVSGRIAATVLLERIAKNIRRNNVHEKRDSAAELIKFLEEPRYQSLYDGSFGAEGGWTKLARQPNRGRFDEIMSAYREETKLPVQIALYRLRYLDHPHTNPNASNLQHAKVFVWCASQKKVSGSTIRNHWKYHKAAAIPLLVSETFQSFAPVESSASNLATKLLKTRRDKESIRRFCGLCAYVEDMLEIEARKLFPPKEELVRVRPETAPLSPQEVAYLSNYKTDYQAFQDN